MLHRLHGFMTRCRVGQMEILPRSRVSQADTHFSLHPIVPVAQVLQVGGGVGLHRGEVVLQHVDHLRQLRVAPGKLPEKHRRW